MGDPNPNYDRTQHQKMLNDHLAVIVRGTALHGSDIPPAVSSRRAQRTQHDEDARRGGPAASTPSPPHTTPTHADHVTDEARQLPGSKATINEKGNSPSGTFNFTDQSAHRE